ncbi:hypothetical protein DYJ09_09735 [Salmonella enterica]|nr:hypothetical protein [Salmonella enterica]EBY6655457.1 hypothetical protein [Salmonella enterica subsp. enterica serovar Oranienburg]EDS7046639.1 hypothetical protein [Salmonella enterica subsp. enterica]ECC3821341.1 hypothetical protein [Salmonella enterica]EDV3448787.1 hypothetical protein [Salmonella enterica subsp. enterica]
MTPRQRRAHRSALEKAASAPNKRWLGKSVLLTGTQSAWISSLLSVWGECERGEAAPRAPHTHTCWQSLRGGRWSDKALARFTEALTQARKEGFRGERALKRARAILWPVAPVSVIDKAITNDDADFIESCVLEAFEQTDPVYIVGVQYYTTRKKIADITRELQQIAPWLTNDEARKRVRWCLEIFRARVFLSARRQLREAAGG